MLLSDLVETAPARAPLRGTGRGTSVVYLEGSGSLQSTFGLAPM